MNAVDFFIIGAQKAGTTSLYNYLSEHPDIFMPQAKENHFFAEDRFYKKGIEFFHRYYRDYSGQQIKGGAYVHLFSSPQAPERIYNYNKNAKILIMLRNPIDRAYSAYHFALKNGWESSNNKFEDTLKLQEQRLTGSYTERTNLSYFYIGLYFKHISNWLKWFPRENICIEFQSSFKKDAPAAMKNIFKYLGVSGNASVSTEVIHNKSGAVKFKALHFLMRNQESSFKKALAEATPFSFRKFVRMHIRKKIDSWNMVEKQYEPLSLETREKVFSYFDEDVKQLSEFLGTDLYSQWKP
jgi:hypothetical protein